MCNNKRPEALTIDDCANVVKMLKREGITVLKLAARHTQREYKIRPTEPMGIDHVITSEPVRWPGLDMGPSRPHAADCPLAATILSPDRLIRID